MVNIGIFDEQKLMLEGLSSLFNDSSDIKVAMTCDDKSALTAKLKNILIHVLVINMHEISVRNLNMIIQLNITFPKLKILIMSAVNSEEMILKTIKAGAKGFLGRESSRTDMLEAILTLRNGHDYYSKSIGDLLMNKYISNINLNESQYEIDINSLSSRQVEILRMWGEGFSNQEIADKFYISVRTVESHKNHIMQKLNLKSTVDLVKFAIKNNIIEI